MNKLIAAWIVSVLGGAAPSVSFQPPRAWKTNLPLRTSPPAPSQMNLSADPYFLGGSFLWGLNFYYGFDWLLAPLGTGLDSDFNPAYRTATFVGSLLAGKSPAEALEASGGPITDEEGDRPELGSRIGSGANVGYTTAVANSETDTDWLSDREAGLRSSPPLPLQLLVALAYGLVGVLVMTVTDSLQTAAVLSIPAAVYEIGRPSLPTREEAILDAQLDQAVTTFCNERLMVYGQEIVPDGVAPVKRDEATNERELVAVFKRELELQQSPLWQNQDLSDVQIEMRFRELGTGRSEGGYIKGIRLLREPVSWQ